ncbi:hypothetical protein D9758_010247 [Tetrapyrgos nigripes]|uniref:RNase H type-1 domain-containing protein n=1 Tax=Tetrapyrgos nigripes TaxID=182062 RepID=A0A8H5LL52_9AGAR|nr:hypothetical protein D9758_010247 [Tetrapyrgos nigripes]
MEKRKVVRFTAQWDPNLELQVWDDKEAATEALREDKVRFQFFTDGSGKDRGVGASVVYYQDGQYKGALQYHLGSENSHKVYEGECIGLILALHMLTKVAQPTSVSIWADNTAAITATDTSTRSLAHYLHDIFHTILITLRKRHPPFVSYHILGTRPSWCIVLHWLDSGSLRLSYEQLDEVITVAWLSSHKQLVDSSLS